MTPPDTLAGLSRAAWQESAKSAGALTSLGVAHGFFGCGDLPPADAYHARQVHGTALALAPSPGTVHNLKGGEKGGEDGGKNGGERQAADGVMTTTPGICVAAKSADCVPVLLLAPGQAAAAVHAGWRGLTAGILGAAVRALAQTGVAPAELHAAIGPAIGRERYEVGPEVVEALYGRALGLRPEQAGLCVAKGKGDRWHADLQVAGVLALLNAGVAPERVTVIRACTYSDQRWNSFRRDGKGVGSNWSWVRL